MSGAVTGLQGTKTTESGDSGPRWYQKTPLGLHMADGTGRAVQGDRHLDPVAEALRWQIAEAEVFQAIGRARAVNRTADELAFSVVEDDGSRSLSHQVAYRRGLYVVTGPEGEVVGYFGTISAANAAGFAASQERLEHGIRTPD